MPTCRRIRQRTRSIHLEKSRSQASQFAWLLMRLRWLQARGYAESLAPHMQPRKTPGTDSCLATGPVPGALFFCLRHHSRQGARTAGFRAYAVSLIPQPAGGNYGDLLQPFH